MSIKKALLAFACSSLLSAGLIAVISGQKPAFGAEPSFVVTQQRGKLDVVDEDVSVGGNAVYLAYNASSVNWGADGAKFAVYFFNEKGNGWTGVMTLVGNDNYGNTIYEGTVPSNNFGPEATHLSWTTMIGVRLKSDTISFDNKHNQTSNIPIEASKNQIKITGWGEGDRETWTTSARERISFWASAPDQWTSSGVCLDSGLTDEDTLRTKWNGSSVTYSSIAGADVKSYFSNLTAKKATEGGNDVEDLAARYDHIRAAHSSLALSNFANR